jgi:glutaredoxin
MTSPAFTMYSTPWCGYCHRLRAQLDREGISYEVVDIEQVPDAASLVERSTTATRPSRRWSTPTGRRRRTRLSPRSRRSSPRWAEARRRPHHWPGSGPPYHASTSEREIEMPPGSTSVPASASAFISSRVNQRASLISSRRR